MSDATRTCTGCGRRKLKSEYYRRPNGSLQAECKECAKARGRAIRDAKRAGQGLTPLDRSWQPRIDEHGRACNVCRTYKSWDAFHRTSARGAINGHTGRCKPCVSAVLAARAAERGGQPYTQHWGDGWRVCTTCKQHKALDEFGPREAGRFGRNSRCKACINRARQADRAADPDARAKERRYEQRQDVQARNSARHAARHYGITVEQYEWLHAQQQGSCTLCHRRRKLVVDHCHRTGVVRGLLCHSCNVALGQVDDDVALLQRMIVYVESRGVSLVPTSEPTVWKRTGPPTVAIN